MKSLNDLDKVSPWHFDFGALFRRRNRLKGADFEYMQDVREALMAQATPGSSAILYLMVILTVIALTWASIAKVDEVTQAEARVIPTNREQVVNSLEGGLMSGLFVKEGDQVTQGQAIVQLEPTRFESQYKEGFNRQLSLKAARARAQAEAFGAPLSFPRELANNKSQILLETQTYNARKTSLDESVKALRKSLELISNEIQISEKLARQGLF